MLQKSGKNRGFCHFFLCKMRGREKNKKEIIFFVSEYLTIKKKNLILHSNSERNVL
jgi:hypothetical protein